MGRSHAQQFANHTLPRAVFADPVALTRAIASGDAPGMLAALWEQAGAEVGPIARIAGTGIATTLVRRGRFVTAIVTPPPPRASGDPAAIAIIGLGDGVTKLSTLAYFVLELVLDRVTGAPSFALVSRNALGEQGASFGDGPLPDPRWLAEHAYALYTGHAPEARTGVPDLPVWYWWHALGADGAVRAFDEAAEDADRFEVVRKAPVLLMPEIADAGELYLGANAVRRLRLLRPYLRRATTLAPAWRELALRLANTSAGSPAANATRALPLIAEACKHGALTRAEACELEAVVRSKLAGLGVDASENYALSAQLFAAAAAPVEQAPRLARGSAPPPISAEDPVWKPLFLDETDLPHCVRAESEEAFSSCEPTFVAHAGLRAGYAVWGGDDRSPMARIVDSRWVFRTATAATYFMRAVAAGLGDGLPALPAPELGDETLAFGDDIATAAGIRRAHVIVVRVGRLIARLLVTDGVHAAASRQILHAAMLQPLAARIAQRMRQGLASYWLAVAYPTNAVAALVHSPGYDAARLLQQYPLLALPDLPAALAAQGESYAPVARSLASFQAQVRAHRWATYRAAMLALVRSLLETDMGDPRVNVSQAYEIVSELRFLDPDPIWMQLDAECRARG